MMDDFIEDYLAYELFEEAFCVQTDVECPNGESALLYDQEREVYLCPDCRGEFVNDADITEIGNGRGTLTRACERLPKSCSLLSADVTLSEIKG